MRLLPALRGIEGILQPVKYAIVNDNMAIVIYPHVQHGGRGLGRALRPEKRRSGCVCGTDWLRQADASLLLCTCGCWLLVVLTRVLGVCSR